MTSRRPAGVPTGGQFAPGQRKRAVIELTEDSEIIELLEAEPDQIKIARAEAASMPYDLGRRYVEARVLEMRAAATARGLFQEAEALRRTGLSEFLEHGGTPDKIEIYDTVYYRARPGRTFSQPYSMMLVADRPISDDEMQHLAQLAGYAYAATVHGEQLNVPERVSPYAFTVYADTTKGRGYIGDFIEQYPAMITEGSPVRTTDRAGDGTRGTRLVEGMGEDAPKITMYFDDVAEDGPEESAEQAQKS